MSGDNEQPDDPLALYVKELEEKVKNQKLFIEDMETQKRKLLIAAHPESQWCSYAGFVMAKLISVALDHNDAMVLYIINEKQVKVTDFLAIVHSVLKCFLQKYDEVLPTDDSEEVKFLMTLLEVVWKLSSHPAGRAFFANDEYGLGLIKQFIVNLPDLPIPSGDALKRAMLLPVFNTFSRAGPSPADGWRELLVACEHSLRVDKDIANHMLLLSTVVNVSHNPPSPDFAPEFVKLMSSATLEAASRSEAGGVAVMATHVQKTVLQLLKQSREPESTGGGQEPGPMVAVPCPGSKGPPSPTGNPTMKSQ
ncbi:uncharacterized protein LOC134536218 isoform X1 [Bacillus rossius redtenbacheri]